jgi:hypothetical protein
MIFHTYMDRVQATDNQEGVSHVSPPLKRIIRIEASGMCYCLRLLREQST